MPGAKGTKRPRKRGKYYIDNPMKYDCLWCPKKVESYRKCSDPTFKPQQVHDNDVAYSDSTIEDQADSTITKKDFLSLSKSTKSAIRRSKKFLVKRIGTLSVAVENITTIAMQNNLIEQNNSMKAVSDACKSKTAKINSIEDSINNIKKSSSSGSNMKQLYMEFNDRQFT